PLRAAGQRQVEDVAAALVGMAPVIRIVGCRIGMDRGEEYLVMAGNDILRAVAVMIVDVEDRDALLGGERADRGVAEVGVAAEIIATGMVAWRRPQGEGASLPAKNRLKRRKRRLCTPVCGVPCAWSD